MAYQNVGQCRFYVNILEWLHSVGGLTNSTNLDMALTSPISPITRSSTYDWNGSNNCIFFPEVVATVASLIGTKGFVAHLGHNYKSCELSVQADQGSPDYYSVGFTEDVINSTQYADGRIKCDYDGFSIYLADYSSQADNPQLNPRLRYDYIGSGDAYNGVDVKVGSIILGSYYDIPHSPDLKLTMTREMDGVKRIRTKGGNDLVHHKYTKPPMWGRAAPWGIYGGEPIGQELARSGRRVWDLSFSYLQDNDVFPELSSIEPYESTSAPDNAVPNDPYSDGDEWHIGATILDDDTFYNQVIHKTNGGQLPFIFQPDGSNNSPDGFAICKFDMNSFEFEQVAKNIYNINLKIREVW